MTNKYAVKIIGSIGSIAFMWWELQQSIKEWKAPQNEIDEWFEQRKVYWESKTEKE